MASLELAGEEIATLFSSHRGFGNERRERRALQNLSRRVTAKSFPSPPSVGHQVAGPLGATSFGLIFAFLPTIDK